MKRVAVLFILFSLVSFAQQKESEAVPLKIMTYNILGGRNTDGSKDIKKIAEVINRIKPDIVALQEVDRETNRIDGIDLPDKLSKLTSMRSAFARAMFYDNGEYGEAILTNLNFTDSVKINLPHKENSEPRVALSLNLKIRDQEFRILATHLDHQEDETDRLNQAKSLIDFTNRTEILTFLVGDLNCKPSSKTYNLLSKSYSDCWQREAPGFTYPSNKPERRIDYILSNKTKSIKIKNIYTGDEFQKDNPNWQNLLRKSSDHLPLIAEIELIK